MKPPVVVLPGITATKLRDMYPPDPEDVWGIIRKDYLRVALHPDDLRYEQLEPALLRTDEAFGIPYDEFVRELRHDLSPKRDRPRPVFLFPYDWRIPLDPVVEQLRDFCDEVAARTALLRHYAKSGYTADKGRVDLVGHSMGGLIITGYLAKYPKEHRARKVVTLGTPYKGSFEAVAKIATGTADLGGGSSKSREREVARITPAIYHLLPEDDAKKAITVDTGLPKSLFDAGLWQEGIIETLAEHIRLNAVDPPSSQKDRMAAARKLLQGMLDEAKEYRGRVHGLDLAAAGLETDDWMAIVGVGDKTRVRLKVIKKKGKPFFDLRSMDRVNGYPKPDQNAALTDTGDGTVPYWAAIPPFLDSKHLIAVSDDDFGYWEWGDKGLDILTGLHGMLPEMNRVAKLAVAFLDAKAGEKGKAHPGIKGRRAPDIDPDDDWDPPIKGLKEEKP